MSNKTDKMIVANTVESHVYARTLGEQRLAFYWLGDTFTQMETLLPSKMNHSATRAV